jgi:CHASE2 domain-containing sensor protein
MKFKYLIVVSAVLICCKSQPELAIDNGIILVNTGRAGRVEISEALDRLAKCRPKVVGINFVFSDRQKSSSDLRLAKSIKASGNIVLVSLLRDQDIISSDSLFVSSALGEGIIHYGVEEDGSVSKHVLYTSVGDNLVWSFPTALASFFDIGNSDHIMRSAQGNQFYKINYQNDFKVVDINEEFDCTLFSDKIVLVGYLGPDNKDLYLTSFGQRRYSTWILANCVQNIRDGHLEPGN